MAKLLAGEPKVLELLGPNPFPEKPPTYVRVLKYRYRFTEWGSEAYWTRELQGVYLPALSLDDPSFRQLLEQQGWLAPVAEPQ